MEQPDSLYEEHKLTRISAATLNLGEGEREVAQMVQNDSDYSGDKLSSSSLVPGNLSRGSGPASFYRDVLQAPEWVCDTVAHGYKFPLVSPPPATTRLKNNQSSLVNKDFTSPGWSCSGWRSYTA